MKLGEGMRVSKNSKTNPGRRGTMVMKLSNCFLCFFLVVVVFLW